MSRDAERIADLRARIATQEAAIERARAGLSLADGHVDLMERAIQAELNSASRRVRREAARTAPARRSAATENAGRLRACATALLRRLECGLAELVAQLDGA